MGKTRTTLAFHYEQDRREEERTEEKKIAIEMRHQRASG